MQFTFGYTNSLRRALNSTHNPVASPFVAFLSREVIDLGFGNYSGPLYFYFSYDDSMPRSINVAFVRPAEQPLSNGSLIDRQVTAGEKHIYPLPLASPNFVTLVLDACYSDFGCDTLLNDCRGSLALLLPRVSLRRNDYIAVGQIS